MRAWVRAGGRPVRFRTRAAFHNLIAQGLGVDVDMDMGMGIGLNMDRMDLDMEMDGLNPNQAVSSDNTEQAGPVTGG